jgi:hypothetical protein
MKKKASDLDREIVSITKQAIAAGYRHLDGAEGKHFRRFEIPFATSL